MASSELQKRKQEEYEMQLFNFHSRAVYATLKNIISERIHCTIEKLCETIEKTYKLNSEDQTVLKTNQKRLERTYIKAALQHLENIENIVNKYIAVPSNVLLEEDKHQRVQYTESEFESFKARLDDLQQRAKRATVLNTVLREEWQVLEQFQISETDVNKKCNIIEKGLNCKDVNNKLYQLVEDYKMFTKRLFDGVPMTKKIKYNTVDNLKCIDIDLCNL